jgi:hypothetical protein
LLVVTTGIAAVAATGAPSARRAGSEFTATLNARQEVPRPRGTKRGAAGRFVGKLARGGDREVLEWTLTFRQLTGRPTGAHIHYGRPGKVGGIAIRLCTRCTKERRSSGSITGSSLMYSRPAMIALRNGRVYVNVHTRKNPKGEIRGNIRIVG